MYNSEINTISVDISVHVLKVGSKSMTLSFLKQIQKVPYENIKLKEVNILGYVNYFPEKDGEGRIYSISFHPISIDNLYNIVFVDNGKLKRSYFPKTKYPNDELKQLFIAV